MSILIRGMEMPKNCSDCPLNHDQMMCIVTGTRWWSDTMVLMNFDSDKERLPDCPLTEIKEPHGRLGDLDALIKDLAVYRGGHNEGYGFDGGMYEAYNNSIELVEDAPTVIEAEGSETE